MGELIFVAHPRKKSQPEMAVEIVAWVKRSVTRVQKLLSPDCAEFTIGPA
jgi:hypothetical protein